MSEEIKTEAKQNQFDLTEKMTITLPKWVFLMIPLALLWSEATQWGFLIWLAILVQSTPQAQISPKDRKSVIVITLTLIAFVVACTVTAIFWDQIALFVRPLLQR